MITQSPTIRGLVAWLIAAVMLLPALAGVDPAAGQDAVALFPDGVEVLTSLETPIAFPATPGLSLRLASQTLDSSQVIDDAALADPLLVFVDAGTPTVAVRTGAETAYPAGSQFVLHPGGRYTLRNDAADPASLLLLGLAPGSDADDAPPQPLFVGGTTFFTTKVATALFPARLLLTRLSWEPGADSGSNTSAGPLGFVTESGALAVTGRCGEERELEPGEDVVFRAGTVHRQRNAGVEAAVVLAAALIPDGAPLFEPTASGPKPKLPGCDESAGSNPSVIGDDGDERPYLVWVAWTPALVIGKDCEAVVFFSAEARHSDGSLGAKRLYAARFDPTAGAWDAAAPLPGEIQFGPAAVVDDEGTVHLVFSDRANDRPASYARLVYVRSTESGVWTEPVAVAPHEDAGHRLSPELLIDANGALHVAWQDQRSVDEAARVAAASNADIFASELGADGAWSDPVRLSTRLDA